MDGENAPPPDPDNPPTNDPANDDEYSTVPVGEQTGDATSHTVADGTTRLSAMTCGILTEAVIEAGKAQLHPHAEVKEGRTSRSFYLVAADEDNENKVNLRWGKAGRECYVSLAKVLSKKGIVIPRGQALEMDAYPARLGNIPAVELRFREARFVKVQSRKGTAGQGPAVK